MINSHSESIQVRQQGLSALNNRQKLDG